ncbi:hypothetical protein GCM10009566_49990 [Streptomyces murinus]
MAGRYTPSFFAAVAGFIVWVLCCDFMRTRVSAVRAAADHEPGGGRSGSRPVTMGGAAAGNLAW